MGTKGILRMRGWISTGFKAEVGGGSQGREPGGEAQG